jgi:hypothetical protein
MDAEEQDQGDDGRTDRGQSPQAAWNDVLDQPNEVLYDQLWPRSSAR